MKVVVCSSPSPVQEGKEPSQTNELVSTNTQFIYILHHIQYPFLRLTSDYIDFPVNDYCVGVKTGHPHARAVLQVCERQSEDPHIGGRLGPHNITLRWRMVSAQLRSDQRANKCGVETADLMSFDTVERTACYCLGTHARMLIATWLCHSTIDLTRQFPSP